MMVGDALPLCIELAHGSVPSEERGYINSIRDYITEMKGEEATANLRLQRERIMPIMDAYLEKIEKAAAAQ